jgi:hypothetical protein
VLARSVESGWLLPAVVLHAEIAVPMFAAICFSFQFPYNMRMEPWIIGVFLRPFAALIIFGLIALPIRLLLGKVLPNNRFKEILLRPIGKQPHRTACERPW